MKQDDFSYSEELNAHVDELVQALQQRQHTHRSITDAPELRMAHDIRHAYQAETHEDARSLERVLARLKGEQAEVQQAKVLLLPRVSQQQERMTAMQNSPDALAGGRIGRRWRQRAGVLVAILFLALLVGGGLTVLNVTRSGSPLASNVVTSLALSDNANQAGQQASVQHFTAGQTIWLTGLLDLGKTRGSGVLVVKWYENDHLFAITTRDFQTPEGQSVPTALKAITLRANHTYGTPGNGKAEVYWNGQLVTTLHFVIEQNPQK